MASEDRINDVLRFIGDFLFRRISSIVRVTTLDIVRVAARPEHQFPSLCAPFRLLLFDSLRPLEPFPPLSTFPAPFCLLGLFDQFRPVAPPHPPWPQPQQMQRQIGDMRMRIRNV